MTGVQTCALPISFNVDSRNLIEDINSLLSWEKPDIISDIPSQIWIEETDAKKYDKYNAEISKKSMFRAKLDKQPFGFQAISPLTIREKIKLVLKNKELFNEKGIVLPDWPYNNNINTEEDSGTVNEIDKLFSTKNKKENKIKRDREQSEDLIFYQVDEGKFNKWKNILKKLYRGGKNKIIIFPETKYLGICYQRVGSQGKWMGEVNIPNTDTFKVNNYTFKIVGITYHGGTSGGGHYVAEKISLDGNFFKVKRAQSKPLLYKNRKPKILSAAFSPSGRNFALKNCDILVTMFSDITALKNQVTSIKRKSKKKNKKFEVFTLCHIVCKKTNKQAQEYYDDYSKYKIDKIAVSNFSNIIANNPKNKIIKKIQKKNLQKMAGGIGSYPIVGSPKKVISELDKIRNSGIDGVVVSFLNYKDEIKFFTQKVLNVINK